MSKLPKAKNINKYNVKFVYDSNFKSKFEYKFTKKGIITEYKKYQSQKRRPKTGCIVDFYSYYNSPEFGRNKWSEPYLIASFFSLFIIPYYHPRIYGYKAKLIDARTNKILKQYSYTEKANKIISSLITIPALITPIGYNNKYSFEGSAKYVQDKTQEALVRQVTYDITQFKECQK